MKIYCDIVFTDEMVDPLYEELGIAADAEVVEIVEQGMVDLTKVVAANQHYELTQIHLISGQSLYIDLEFDYFCKLWKTI